jgi:hypothetical protein
VAGWGADSCAVECPAPALPASGPVYTTEEPGTHEIGIATKQHRTYEGRAVIGEAPQNVLREVDTPWRTCSLR